MSSENSQVEWKPAVVSHWTNLAKIKQWLGVTAVQNLEDEAERIRKNREAEESYVRRKVWGSSEESTGDEEMRQTVLGDYNITQIPQQSSSLGPLILGAGLLAAGAGLPIAAYLASQPKAVTPAKNTTINQGLDEDTTIQLTLPEWSE